MSDETWIFEIEGIPVPVHAKTKAQALMAKRYIEALAKEKREKEQKSWDLLDCYALGCVEVHVGFQGTEISHHDDCPLNPKNNNKNERAKDSSGNPKGP